MASSRVANQRRRDSHMTQVRTTDRCSSLTSALQQRGGSSVPGIRSGLAGPHTEHAPPAISTASASSQTSNFLNFCKLCFLSVLLGGRESVVGPVLLGNLVLSINLVCGPLGGQRSMVMEPLGGQWSRGWAQPT